MNIHQVVGNIGQDVRHITSNGSDFISFSLADTERWKDASEPDGYKERTTWYSVTTRAKSLLPYLTKGAKVWVVGSLRVSLYRSEKDGHTRIDLTINADRISLEGRPKSTENSPGSGTDSNPVSPGPEGAESDDLPY